MLAPRSVCQYGRRKGAAQGYLFHRSEDGDKRAAPHHYFTRCLRMQGDGGQTQRRHRSTARHLGAARGSRHPRRSTVQAGTT